MMTTNGNRDDDLTIPDFLRIPQERRNKLWEEHPPQFAPKGKVPGENGNGLTRRQQYHQKRYQQQKELETSRKQSKEKLPKITAENLDGIRWDSRNSRWVVDPLHRLSQEDKMKLKLTTYDANGLILPRGRTSIADTATEDEIKAKVQYAIGRAGRKTRKVEITKGDQIVDTHIVTETDFTSPAAVASAAEATEPDAAEQETTKMAKKNGKKTARKSGNKAPRGPGIIATIVELMQASKGASMKEVLAVLVKKFPTHKAKSMESTCKIQMPRNAKSKEMDDKRGLVYYAKA